MQHEDIHLAKASGAGNKVILYGARTGGDGIGGVSVLASETFDDAKPSKRPAVQVGDPFQEKLLIECTLEVFQEKLVVGIQDLGARRALLRHQRAGLRRLRRHARRAGHVPLRDSTLSPEEILMSESQERMCAVVEPEQGRPLPGDLREVGRHRHRHR